MILFFVYTHDLIQKLVKMETSLLAARQTVRTKEGDVIEMADHLVMDEDHETQFRKLYFDARAEIVLHIPAVNLAETPTDLSPVLREFQDFSTDRDFCLWLKLHEDWPTQYQKSIDTKIQSYLVDYICYRWLEKISPNNAASYFGRLDKTVDDIQRMLVRRVNGVRRLPSFP